MNARDFKQKPAEKVTPQNVLSGNKQKTSIWDKLSDLSIDTFADKIKLIIIFTIVGLGTILVGDLLKLIPLRGTGIAFQIMGWIIISIGFLIPFFKALDEHS
jgi:hypothetical protein